MSTRHKSKQRQQKFSEHSSTLSAPQKIQKNNDCPLYSVKRKNANLKWRQFYTCDTSMFKNQYKNIGHEPEHQIVAKTMALVSVLQRACQVYIIKWTNAHFKWRQFYTWDTSMIKNTIQKHRSRGRKNIQHETHQMICKNQYSREFGATWLNKMSKPLRRNQQPVLDHPGFVEAKWKFISKMSKRPQRNAQVGNPAAQQ